jgi:S1-C subfamily serine protease
VEPGPAQSADLRPRDVVIAINDRKIGSEDDLRAAIRALGPGKSRYQIRRGNDALTLVIECPAC